MKIALCAPADLHELARFSGQSTNDVACGLGSTATTPLLCEFLSRGHEVTLYTLSNDISGERVYRWDNLRIVAGPFRTRHLASTYYAPEIRFLRKRIQADAPAFVYAHWTYEFALGALRTGIPTLTTIHDLPWNVLRYYRDPHRAVRLLMAYEVALRGTHFSAVSSAAARHFARHIKPGARIAVIPNGLPEAIFAMGRRDPMVRHTCMTFATVLQGWSSRKNATAALRAFASARRELRCARLLMFGEDYEANGRAHQWARLNRLDRDVTFAGKLHQRELLRRVSNEVDFLVHPSRDEAFSMTALEAMALRKPLIAGETTPGMREMLGPGGGLLIDVRNPATIAQAMVQLAANGNYRTHLATHSYERALQHYHLTVIADAYESLYRETMQAVCSGAITVDSRSNLSLDM